MVTRQWMLFIYEEFNQFHILCHFLLDIGMLPDEDIDNCVVCCVYAR